MSGNVTAVKTVGQSNDPILWGKKNLKKLAVVNPGDFPLDAILKGIGISHNPLVPFFGIYDEEEIIQRQKLLNFFMQHPEMIEKVRALNVSVELPGEEVPFFRDIVGGKESNKFWQVVKNLFSDLNEMQASLPPRLIGLRSWLEMIMKEEANEKKFADEVAKKLERTVYLEGLLNFFVKVENGCARMENMMLESSDVYGYQLYSKPVSECEVARPEWISNKKHILSRIGFGRIAEKLCAAKEKRRLVKAYRTQLISTVDDAMRDDIIAAIYNLNAGCLRKDLDGVARLYLRVYFSYDCGQLKVRVVKVSADFKGDFECDVDDLFQPKAAWPANYKFVFDKHRRETARLITSAYRAAALDKIRRGFVDSVAEIGKNAIVPGDRLKNKYRYQLLLNIYSDKNFIDPYSSVNSVRRRIENQFIDLRSIAQIAEAYLRLSVSLPVSFPTINPANEHIVEFDSIVPIHLVRRIKGADLVPVRGFPSLNARIIGLTGLHGGGKTETQLALAGNIYLAQSGLPVFAERFSLNLKEVIGVLAIERGEGSTIELIIKKTINLLKGIEDVSGEKVVLFIDELGSATQENDGYQLGCDLLTVLNQRKVSVIFTTQIMKMAEFAKDNLGALPVWMDRDHQIHEGINDGGLNALREELGLNKLMVA